MTGLSFAVFFCVLIIQRVASQNCNCQTELFISIDDLLKALNNGPGIPGLIETNQIQCQPPCQQSCQPNQQISQPQPKTSFVLGPPTFSISGFNLPNQGSQQPIQISQPSCQSLQISQPSQQCGCQNLQISPSQCGCQSIQISQPSCQQNQQLSISNPVSFQPCQQSQQKIQQTKGKTESASYIIPAALLQAPPYGLIFAGDNLLIDGAVQVCGNLPFNSIVELGGVMPSSGSGCVQYSCGDSCSMYS